MKNSAIVLSLILSATLASAVSQKDLSLSAQNSINKMERTIAAAKKTAVTELTALMKNETRMGNREKADTLDKIIKQIEEESPSIITERSANSDYFDDILGSWSKEGGHSKITFNKDGTCTEQSIRVVDGMSTWKIESKKLIVTNKKTNNVITYQLPPKKVNRRGRKTTVLEGKSDTGHSHILTRR